jgi:hypothetical protein
MHRRSANALACLATIGAGLRAIDETSRVRRAVVSRQIGT